MRKILIALLALTFSFTGCGGEPNSSDMKHAQQTEVRNTESIAADLKGDAKSDAQSTPEDSALPAKISKLSSIGTTLAEFRKTYKPTQTDIGLFTYGRNKDFTALFWDDNFQPTNEKTTRASNFAIWKAGIPEDSLKDYLPSDAQVVTEEIKDSDDLVVYKYYEGYSDMLAMVYPQSEGQWWAGFHFDRATGKYLYGAIYAERWNE